LRKQQKFESPARSYEQGERSPSHLGEDDASEEQGFQGDSLEDLLQQEPLGDFKGEDKLDPGDLSLASISHFPSQLLMDSKHFDSVADMQDVTTVVRNVTPTQFGQMICCIRHGLARHAIHDLVTLIKRSAFFRADEMIEYDQIKNRHRQLLPLLPLYCKILKVVRRHKQVSDQGFSKKLLTFAFHYLSILDIVVREIELLLTGSPIKDHWSNNAVVQSLARGLSDGKVFRTSPQYTFASITIKSTRFNLGDDVLAKTKSTVQLCKISSVFVHMEHSDYKGGEATADGTIAIYIQPYLALEHFPPANLSADGKAYLKAAMRNRVPNELILSDDEILLKNDSLCCIQRTINVVSDPSQVAAATQPHVYVCRYALEGKVNPILVAF